MCLTRLQLKSNYKALIGSFAQETGAVATLPDFKYWHMKHQANCDWMTHSHVATLQLVFALLGNIISNFDRYEFLKSSDSLPCNKHTKLMCLVNETIERFQIVIVTNSISYCDREPDLHSCFQRSIERIPPQQNPPRNRQRNNDNQYQNRQNQQDNRR